MISWTMAAPTHHVLVGELGLGLLQQRQDLGVLRLGLLDDAARIALLRDAVQEEDELLAGGGRVAADLDQAFAAVLVRVELGRSVSLRHRTAHLGAEGLEGLAGRRSVGGRTEGREHRRRGNRGGHDAVEIQHLAGARKCRQRASATSARARTGCAFVRQSGAYGRE